MTKHLVPLVVAIALAGCESTPMEWVKPGATQGQTAGDLAECEYEKASAGAQRQAEITAR